MRFAVASPLAPGSVLLYLQCSDGLLDLQLWFQNSTMNVAKIARAPLDDYFDFIRVAVGSTFSTVLVSTEQFQKEMHAKPGDPLRLLSSD